jgi:hypothetical protein
VQCPDGSDEAGCCGEVDLRCTDGQCVPPNQICDGKEDCPLAEDEKEQDFSLQLPLRCRFCFILIFPQIIWQKFSENSKFQGPKALLQISKVSVKVTKSADSK